MRLFRILSYFPTNRTLILAFSVLWVLNSSMLQIGEITHPLRLLRDPLLNIILDIFSLYYRF